MTREEEIFFQSGKYGLELHNNDPSIDYGDCAFHFRMGAKFADNHPKSPWISVKEDLPCNHQELIVKPRLTTQVLVYPKKGRYAYFDSMILNIDGWEWMLGEVKYWMPVPDLPKEEENKL